MKARDVLIDVLAPVSFYAEEPGTKGDMTARLESHLLAQTPESEGVYIAPDGGLCRLVEYWPDDPGRKLKLYRLVPIEEATDD